MARIALEVTARERLGVESVAASIERRAGISVDGLALLAERATIAGLTRGGDRSCGGATRLLPAAATMIAG